MARFNTRRQESGVPDTVNLAGGAAYQQSTKQEIVGILLTSFAQDEFYRSGDDTISHLSGMIQGADLKDLYFLAQATVYARTKFGMRSISHVAAAELVHRMSEETHKAREKASQVKSGFDTKIMYPPQNKIHTLPWVRKFIDAVIHRVDDASEIMSYYGAKYGKPMPHALLRGVRDNLSRRDAYQLAKYRGETKGLKLIDVVRLTHPKPEESNAEAFQQLVKGTLVSTDTWESTLTRAGQQATSDEEKADLKGAAWATLLAEKKLGHFALLRNLRNIAQQSPESLDVALAQLVDPNQITKSLVMPFRYTTAYREFSGAPIVDYDYHYATRSHHQTGFRWSEPDDGLDGATRRKILLALSNALEISLSNVPKFTGRTMVWLDNSGSMQGTDPKAPIWIGAIFAAVLAKANMADVGTFTDTAKYVNYNPSDSTMTIATNLMSASNPAGTNFQLAMANTKERYDRIFFLSDLQGWMLRDGDRSYLSGGYVGGAPIQEFKDYKKRFQADPWVYSFDLRNYGTMQFNPNNPKVLSLSGFSTEIFKIMDTIESDRDALVHEIEKIQF